MSKQAAFNFKVPRISRQKHNYLRPVWEKC